MRPHTLKTLAAAAVPAILVIIVSLNLFITSALLTYRVFEPPFLLPLLNIVFLGLTSCCVCYFAAKSYYQIGSLNLAMLGSGALAFGLTGISAGWFMNLSDGVNTTVTIFNFGALLAGILHFSGSIIGVMELAPEENIGRRKYKLLFSYGGVFLALVLIVSASLSGWTPVFFVQWVGPSMIRQLVLGLSIVLLLFSGIYLLSLYFKTKNDFCFWYALGLMLIAEGLLGVMLTRAVGGIFDWTGRFAQYVGGIYLLLAVLSMLKERASEEVLSEIFKRPSELYVSMFDNSLDGIVLAAHDGPILSANPSACSMLGYNNTQLGQLAVKDIVGSDPPDVLEFRNELDLKTKARAELVLIRKDGSRFPAAISSVVFKDRRGKSLEIITFKDISERRQAEEIVRGYWKKLEREVKIRTAEIEKQYQQLERLNLLIKQMARHTIKAMENDRRALSKEIHDSISGSLAAIKMLLENRLQSSDQPPPEGIMSLEKIIGHLADTIKESKRISFHMRSSLLDDFGLAAAISESVRKFEEFYPKIEVDFEIDISDDGIHDEIKAVVYRVIQEALNNIGKHSGADSAKIELVESQDQIVLKVEDNGCGFDAASIPDTKQPLQGYGMLSMKERVEICSGNFQVRSEPGKGTLLLASIPKALL